MKKFTEKQIQEYCYVLAREEYKRLVDYRQTKEYEIARQCGIDTDERIIVFISELLIRAFPYIAIESYSKELIMFLEETKRYEDVFITEIVVSQIDQCETACESIKDYAKNQLKERYKYGE